MTFLPLAAVLSANHVKSPKMSEAICMPSMLDKALSRSLAVSPLSVLPFFFRRSGSKELSREATCVPSALGFCVGGIVWPCGGTKTGLKASDSHVKVPSCEEGNLRSSRVFATQLLRPETCWLLQEVMESFRSSTSTLRARTRYHRVPKTVTSCKSCSMFLGRHTLVSVAEKYLPSLVLKQKHRCKKSEDLPNVFACPCQTHIRLAGTADRKAPFDNLKELNGYPVACQETSM